ncbi:MULTISPECIES: DUF5615 family PIN-like protein [Pseudanabaena]|uniref:DUF5615 family PIN-like protein n=1 Tax=Pseudanabaena TaxID=1152 RepID=UPI00247ACE13|nr:MULTISPECIES: DUF5615 family PIN-like protein [Pseudanabaena]MEA5489182.1 DUF5615 family PIN-like protein [Pseudanabaena sp. CCNP1317]WGS73767.1 DUF5615 family PIN-like protein [Pseudanabaena galeata CCNP1313]
MRFIADMGVSQTVVRSLQSLGYDAVHLRDQGLQRLPDALILDKARLEERIVLTFDLDFGDLMAASKENLPSVVIFRLKNTSPKFVWDKLQSIIAECADELKTGAIVVVTDERYRVRRLPIS